MKSNPLKISKSYPEPVKNQEIFHKQLDLKPVKISNLHHNPIEDFGPVNKIIGSFFNGFFSCGFFIFSKN